MPIKNGQMATEADVRKAIKKFKPFPNDTEPKIKTPKAYDDLESKKVGRKNRARIVDGISGKVMMTARSTYELLEKIQNGETWKPNIKPKNSLW